MTALKDILKLALANKNKQAHRVSSDTKQGRQFLAKNSNKQDIHKSIGASQGDSRDRREAAKSGAFGKRDI